MRHDPFAASETPLGFLEAWEQLIGVSGTPTLAPRRGRKPRVPLGDLLSGLTFHVLQGAGTLSEHFEQLFGAPFADSSWSDRRTRLPWEIFAELMRRALRPRATKRQPEAFWRGWRLVALDGTQFNLTNTAQMTAIKKARTRRGSAAFAKLTTTVLLELGLHNPLAAAIGRSGQSEWELGGGLLPQLPRGALLLADRLYGCAAFAIPARAICARVGSHFLLRARGRVQPHVVKRLRDGSRLIRVRLRVSGHPREAGPLLEVREIRVRVGRLGHRSSELRLWTTLMDLRTAPAVELAQLYARRWEHELYYRQLKRDLRRTDVLQSHTVDTAAQEVAAMILASALLAAERSRAAAGRTPVLRVSFSKVLGLVRPLWLMLGVFGDLVTDRQKQQMVRRTYTLMGRCLTAPRRSRTVPRAVRQPVMRWARVLEPQSIAGPLQFRVI